MSTEKILSSDGIPLEISLKKAEKKNKLKALMLVGPLFLFLIITYVFPIGDMLFRSVDDRMITSKLPNTFAALKKWDGKELPEEDVYEASYTSSSGNSLPSHFLSAAKVFGNLLVIIRSSTLLNNISPIGNTYVIIRNKNKGPTSIKAFSLFFFSAFFKLISKGIPSDDNIFSVLIYKILKKKGGYYVTALVFYNKNLIYKTKL